MEIFDRLAIGDQLMRLQWKDHEEGLRTYSCTASYLFIQCRVSSPCYLTPDYLHIWLVLIISSIHACSPTAAEPMSAEDAVEEFHEGLQANRNNGTKLCKLCFIVF